MRSVYVVLGAVLLGALCGALAFTLAGAAHYAAGHYSRFVLRDVWLHGLIAGAVGGLLVGGFRLKWLPAGLGLGLLSMAVALSIVIAHEAARHHLERVPQRAVNIILLYLPAGFATGALTAIGMGRWCGRPEEKPSG